MRGRNHTMSHVSTQAQYQPVNQMWAFAAVMFGAIVAAIVASTMIIMSLMQGQIANALASNTTNQNNASPAPAVSCVVPATTESESDTADASAVVSGSVVHAWMPAHAVVPATVNSYNTNTNTNTTTDNSQKSTSNVTTTYRNSFNDNSKTTKDSNNNLGSFNTDNSDHSVNVEDNTLTVGSNNDNNNPVTTNTVTAVTDNSVTIKDNDTTLVTLPFGF
jgi:hypothetical protein